MIFCLGSVWTILIIYFVFTNALLIVSFYLSSNNFKRLMVVNALFQIIILFIIPLLFKGLEVMCK